MENKEPKTVRLSTVILLFIILILVVALVLMYMYYNKDSKNEVATDTSNTESMNTTKNAEKSTVEELSTTSSIVKELYEYIPVDREYTEDINLMLSDAYQSKKITVNDLDNELILGNAFINTEIPIDERQPYEENIPVTDWYKATPDRLQETIKKMYNTEIEDKSFNLSGSNGNFENGIYTFTFGGGGNSFIDNLRNIEEAYKENDELYIIDTCLKYLTENEVDSNNILKYKFKLYDTSNNNSIILEETVNETEIKDNIDSYVEEHYSSKAKKYKHTFKKNDDGEYYWYSSEPYSEE